jgi:ABC-type transporter Mla subunit MlaD
MLTAVIVAWFLFSSTGVRIPFLQSTYDLTAYVPDADGLNPANRPEVLVAGVKAGSVTSVGYSTSRHTAVIHLALAGNVHGKLFADASISIFPRSALNDLVVDVLPGDPAAGPLRNGTITRSAPAPVNYDRLTGILDTDERTYVQIIVGTLDQMLRNRPGPLRDALSRLPSVTSAASVVSAELATRRRQLTELVGQLSEIVAATGDRGTQLTEAIGAARQTLAVTAARQRELERSISLLPSTLMHATTALTDVSRLAQPLTPALVALRPAARALPTAVSDVRGLLPAVGSTTGALSTLISQGSGPLGSLEQTLRLLAPTARQLSPVAPFLAKTVRTITGNEQSVSNILRFWPGAISSQNALAVVTRAKFFTIVPVDPAVLGLPSSSGSGSATRALTRAAAALRVAHPELFDVPATMRDTPVTILALTALIDQRCQWGQDAACMVLSAIYHHPPRLLGQ